MTIFRAPAKKTCLPTRRSERIAQLQANYFWVDSDGDDSDDDDSDDDDDDDDSNNTINTTTVTSSLPIANVALPSSQMSNDFKERLKLMQVDFYKRHVARREAKQLPRSERKPIPKKSTTTKFTLETAEKALADRMQTMKTYFFRLGKAGKDLVDVKEDKWLQVDGVPMTTLFTSKECRMTKQEYTAVKKQDIAYSHLFPSSKRKNSKNSRDIHSRHRLGSKLYADLPAVAVRHWDDPDKLQALLLRDWLSPDAAIGQQVSALVFTICSEGLMKGCAPSGNVTCQSINRALNDIFAMKHFGVTRQQVQAIKITSTCGSAKLVYKNKDGQLREFQLGNYLDFHLTDEKDFLRLVESLEFTQEYKSYVEAWFAETKAALLQFAPYFMTPGGRATLEKNPDCFDMFKLGLNLVNHIGSTISCHEDNRSALPALLTSTNAAGQNSLWTGGALYLAEGGIEIPYSGRDIVLVNGNRLHGVSMLNPGHEQSFCSRFSMVRFLRSRDFKVFAPHNLTTTKSLSAPPKK